MIQTVEMTEEEKFKMYNKCTKKQLIEMLIEANKHLDNIPYNIKLPYVGKIQETIHFGYD